ncbi:hypothetical protein AB0D30_21090 [Streptomyces sp. NPDC048409]|uniref:hypothetical protein n=1 Tax=Streptomyces sp. NPDC048409 TaxID=3154723 RepID=UPI00343FBD35
MKRLNDARVALKHNGTFASGHQIEQAREALADFFTTVMPKVFDVDFDSIDMVDLLTQPEAKRLLKEAQTNADVGDYIHAMAGLDLAFKALLRHYKHRDWGSRRRPFDFGDDLQFFDEPKISARDRMTSRLAKLSEFMDEAQEALRVMSLGIDYPSFVRFNVTTPNLHAYGNGQHRYVRAKFLEVVTAEDYDWARHFVIESGLRASKAHDLQAMMREGCKANRSVAEPPRTACLDRWCRSLTGRARVTMRTDPVCP